MDSGEVTVGFARNAVLGVADKVIETVKNKKIRHFFLVAGCDECFKLHHLLHVKEVTG